MSMSFLYLREVFFRFVRLILETDVEAYKKSKQTKIIQESLDNKQMKDVSHLQMKIKNRQQINSDCVTIRWRCLCSSRRSNCEGTTQLQEEEIMLTEQRYETILRMLDERGSVTVTELKDLLDASESTGAP